MELLADGSYVSMVSVCELIILNFYLYTVQILLSKSGISYIDLNSPTLIFLRRLEM